MYVRAYSSSRRMNAIIHQLYRLSFICPKSSIPRFFFSLPLLWLSSCKVAVSSPHWHLVLSLASATDSTLWWQVAERATLLFRSSKAQNYRVPLEAGSGAAECDTAWLSSCFRQAVSGCAWQGSCWSNRDGHSTRCCPASRTNTHNLVHARNRRQALWFPPGERASKLFCVKGMRSSRGILWGDRVRGST